MNRLIHKPNPHLDLVFEGNCNSSRWRGLQETQRHGVSGRMG
jgi:hypothetical protein